MACGINVIAVFLACATAASAVFAPFPHGKTTIYRYSTVVEATTTGESTYSSQFMIQGTLDVTHDTRDPKLVNAYNVALSNVETDMYNGQSVDYTGKTVNVSVDTAARVIQEPFLVIYNPNGTFQAVKFDEHEPKWSMHMKIAMATMLQLDFPNIDVENIGNKHNSFVTQEKTIHGDCSVTYEVQPKNLDNTNNPEEFSVNKTYSPIDCVGFAVHEFTNADNEPCRVARESSMLIDSDRDFEVVKQGEGVLIKKLNAYSVIKVLSADGSYYRFVITNTTFEFLQIKDKAENDTPLGNFVTSPIITDMTYRKPRGSYAPNAAVDVSQGRHVVNHTNLPSQLEKLLSEAVDYIKENHLNPNEMDWNQAQTVNKILLTMSYMDSDALQVTFDIFEDDVLPATRAMRMKNIFLTVVSQVGTPASCNFTRNIILQNKVATWTALDMLGKLPLSVKVPTIELLSQMEDLAKFDKSIPAEVRKAGIISFSSLIYRTFKHVPHPEDSTILNKYLHDFIDHVKNEPNYEMKVVYLMAIKNIQVGKIYDLLEPIINGSLSMSNKTEHIQLLAIWAINKAVEEDYSIALRILWPVMVNETLSIKLRVAAYKILMEQAPNEEAALKLHKYVSDKGNEHFYNYHYTNLDSIARSPNTCKTNKREIVRSILEKTPYPPESHKKIRYPLSVVHSLSHGVHTLIDAEKFVIGMVMNEFTGLPEVLQFQHVVMDNDGSVSEFAYEVHVEGHREIIALVKPHFLKDVVRSTMIRDLLKKAATSSPAIKDLHIDIVLMRNGRVFLANHYNSENLGDIVDDVIKYTYFDMSQKFSIDHQNVMFERLYEKQVATDIGVPVVVETRNPTLYSVNINYTDSNSHNAQSGFDVVVELKKWKYGDYSISVYNPMKDVWHAVRSQTALELSLPIRLNVIKKFMAFLKFSFPERPEMDTPIIGLLARNRDLVTVDEEGTQALEESCPTCSHQEVVPNGSEQLNDTREYEESSYDSKDTGLKFSSCIYSCGHPYRSEGPVSYMSQPDMSFVSNISNDWYGLPMQVMMDIRVLWKSALSELQERSCGAILKVEPSSIYPISDINVRLGGKYEDFDRNETILDVPHAEKVTSLINIDIISNLTNTAIRSWMLAVNLDRNRGHLANKLSVEILRKTPDEKNLKICIDAKKNYPNPPADDLKIGASNEEVDTKLTISQGYTDNDNDECDRNQTLLSMIMKAQLSDEQNKRLKYDIENSACSKDTKNPLFASPKNVVPKTINCINEAIRYTTPRKYSVDMMFDTLWSNGPNIIDRFFVQNFNPSENGITKFELEFPMERNTFIFRDMTNNNESTDVETDFKDLRNDGEGPVVKPIWDFPLDNSRFSLECLDDYMKNDVRICSIYPQVILTDDGENIPFTIPSDEWILISGDHVDKQFAIFAKQSRPNYLSFVLYVQTHKVHIFTRESDDVLVAMGDDKEPETTEGFRLPLDENFAWIVKTTKHNDHFVIRLSSLSLTLNVGTNYISVVLDADFQGHVSGLCGHLSGISNNNTKPEIFSIKNIT